MYLLIASRAKNRNIMEDMNLLFATVVISALRMHCSIGPVEPVHVRNVRSGSKPFDILIVFHKEFLQKLILRKVS